MKLPPANPNQLDQLLSLQLLRERVALGEVQQQRRKVELLEDKRNEIAACVAAFEVILDQQHTELMTAAAVTPVVLQESQHSRDIIRRDLRREQLFLDTAEQDLSEATAELSSKQTEWQQHRAKAEALCKLEQNQHRATAKLNESASQNEHDERASSMDWKA